MSGYSDGGAASHELYAGGTRSDLHPGSTGRSTLRSASGSDNARQASEKRGDAMPQYDVMLVIEPRRAFGLHEEGLTIVEAGSTVQLNVDPARMTPEERRGKARDPQRRLQISFRINDLHVELDDNVLRASIRADDAAKALAHVERTITRLWRTVSPRHPGGGPFEIRLLRIVEDGELEVVPPHTRRGHIYQYNLTVLAASILDAATLLSDLHADPILDRALHHFALGERLHLGRPQGFVTIAGAEDDLDAEMAPVSFLQYYKALATIVGEMTERDHQSRYQRFRLARAFYEQRIRPLHAKRNQFGVAHLATTGAAGIVSSADVAECRAVAAEAIQAYAAARSMGSDP
jgi:hypothetical protein